MICYSLVGHYFTYSHPLLRNTGLAFPVRRWTGSHDFNTDAFPSSTKHVRGVCSCLLSAAGGSFGRQLSDAGKRSKFQLRTVMAELFPVARGALAASTVPGKASLEFSRKPIPMFQNPADSVVPKAGWEALGQDVQAQCMKPGVWPNFDALDASITIWVLDE